MMKGESFSGYDGNMVAAFDESGLFLSIDGYSRQFDQAEAARLRDWLTAVLARPDDADEPVVQLGCDLGPCSARCVLGKCCFPAASDDYECLNGAPVKDTWQAGYRQGRLDAQAEAAKADDDDGLTTAQELRVWAVEQAGNLSEAAEYVAYVLDGTASA
jgi:hypothetical protein